MADYELFTLICIMFSPGQGDRFHPAGQPQPRVTTAQSGALPMPRGEGRGLPAPQPPRRRNSGTSPKVLSYLGSFRLHRTRGAVSSGIRVYPSRS